jgi:hypothetical protein
LNKEKNFEKLLVVRKYQDYLVWLLNSVNRFPRKQKYLLGDRIGNLALDVLKQLIEIQYSNKEDRIKKFPKFNLDLEELRQLLRVAWKMKFISEKNFLWQELRIDEVGRMVHGLVGFSKN